MNASFAGGCLPLLLAAAVFASSEQDLPKQPLQPSFPGYDLSKPTSSFALPAGLEEISGLTDIDDHTIACVQDERGAVFYVDLRSGSVLKTIAFGPSGDYEGLARVDDRFWVLRSDGLLLELTPRGDDLIVSRRVDLHVGHKDIEGLGYDPLRKVILVAPKDPPSGRKKKKRDKRHVFALDPASGEQQDALALSTSVKRIVADAERAGIWLPTRTTKKGKEVSAVKVRFSAIAVHPVTDQLYVASAIDKALLVFDRDSRLCAAHFFDGRDVPKIEGITFAENGDLIISSEGADSPPLIQVFRYRRDSRDCGEALDHRGSRRSSLDGV
jgi:uncharacterized protein YjiK